MHGKHKRKIAEYFPPVISAIVDYRSRKLRKGNKHEGDKTYNKYGGGSFLFEKRRYPK